MAPKSIFRQPGAKHFQLVHRSQRDPLIHDPDASQHVLKAFVRGNDKKGKTRADLEAILASEVVKHDVRANVGEAALYGIYFDDTEYDYMQHLRVVGTKEDGVESILIEASHHLNESRSKGRTKVTSDDSLHGLPTEALPSKTEMPRNFETQEDVPSSIAGLQPDMDPHLRQTLDALEDDAFVNDDVDDDFFKELVRDGERGEDGDITYEFYEYGPSEGRNDEGEQGSEDESWEVRFAKFKKEQKNANATPPPGSDGNVCSEDGDAVGDLPKLPVIGGKRRRKGTSDASGYSMSSSSMYRTKALLTLDERFDRLMTKEYGSDEDALENDGLETASTSSSLSSSAPDLITSREDYTEMVNKFMDSYELLGRKLKPVLTGESGADKLETLRRVLGQDERIRVIAAKAGDENVLEDEELFRAYNADEKEDRWDCETILTTYSNLENHPRVIRARTSNPVPKIKLDSRTGLPSDASHGTKGNEGKLEDEKVKRVVKQTIGRARGESKEDKKARKQAIKTERQVRRAARKTTREQFNSEIRHQAQELSNKTTMRRIRKL